MLKNKIVLILGGTGSIGSVVAKSFKKNDAKVCVHGRKGAYSADVTNEKQSAKLVRQIINKFGRIDILVNATSAPLKIASLEEKKWADFSGHLDVQLKSAVVFTKLILPYMKKQKWGRIINILSTGIIGQPPSNLSDYISAKYAAWGLTKCLAKELGRFNITVNAVSPNFIKNKFSSVFPEKMAELVASQTPGGKLATPQDVADKVLFLASEKASKINGENIIVSGG